MANKPLTPDVTEALEKGVVHEAATALALAATLGAGIVAHQERKGEMASHFHPADMEHAGQPMMEQEDPTRPRLAASAAKAQTLKQKLNNIRESIKAPGEKRAPASDPRKEEDPEKLHESCVDGREDLAKECKSCGFLHKSAETCWKGASGKSLKELQKAELANSSTPKKPTT